MSIRSSGRSALLLFLCFALGFAPIAAGAQATTPLRLTGRVLDAQTGLPLAGATISVIGRTQSATTGAQGTFEISGLHPGLIVLRIERAGYQTATSDEIALLSGQSANVTLSLAAAATGGEPRTIGQTSVRGSESLQKSATFYRSLSADTLIANGTYRGGDALRLLPGVNNGITGDTAALGDDLQLNIRGIGTAETIATLDGHPIAYGLPGGFNYQLSPVMGLRAITVTYGSGGSDLLGVNAIGGVVDFQTLEADAGPSRDLHPELRHLPQAGQRHSVDGFHSRRPLRLCRELRHVGPRRALPQRGLPSARRGLRSVRTTWFGGVSAL